MRRDRVLVWGGILAMLLLAVCCASNNRIGQLCQGGSECGAGACLESKCTVLCTTQTACTGGMICVLNPTTKKEQCVSSSGISLSNEALETLKKTGWEDPNAADATQGDTATTCVPPATCADTVAPADLSDVVVSGDVADTQGPDGSSDVVAPNDAGDTTAPSDSAVGDGEGDVSDATAEDVPPTDTADAAEETTNGCTKPVGPPCASLIFVTAQNQDWPPADKPADECTITDQTAITVTAGARLYANSDGYCGCDNSTYFWDGKGIGAFGNGNLVVDLSAVACSKSTVVVSTTGPLRAELNDNPSTAVIDEQWETPREVPLCAQAAIQKLHLSGINTTNPGCYGFNVTRIDIW